jgi:hypothetical protein
MMHPSKLEDADWMPPRRLKEDFGKYLKQEGLEIKCTWRGE